MLIKIRYLLVAVLLFTSFITAQNQNKPAKTNIGTRDNFFLDILNYKSEKQGQTKIETFIQVPYSTIQFIKTDNSFLGKYSVTLSFLSEQGDKLYSEKIWKEKIVLKDYKITLSKKISNISRRTFYLQPGMYLIRTSIEDKETKREFVKSIKFKVRNLSENFSVSSIMFVENMVNKNENSKIVPNISKNVVKQVDGIPVYYEIYSLKKIDAVSDYIILDKDEELIYQETVPVKIDSGINNIIYTVKDTTINLGTYQLKVIVKNKNDELLGKTDKIFFSKWTGAPSNITDLETAIEQLEYIATDEQINYIEEAPTKKEKIKRYKEFWKSKDPNPADEENQVFNEYYRRINLANNNFSHYSRPGWKTDRGMVFIILGPPNNIDDRPFRQLL